MYRSNDVQTIEITTRNVSIIIHLWMCSIKEKDNLLEYNCHIYIYNNVKNHEYNYP